jgi:hypothetical protein
MSKNMNKIMNVNVQLREQLIGMTLEKVRNTFKDNIIRVVKENGKDNMITMDIVTTRINVEIHNNLIVELISIG